MTPQVPFNIIARVEHGIQIGMGKGMERDFLCAQKNETKVK